MGTLFLIGTIERGTDVQSNYFYRIDIDDAIRFLGVFIGFGC